MKKGFFTKLIYLFLLITAVNFAQAPSANLTNKVSFKDNLASAPLVLYKFNEGSGFILNDSSGIGTPLNLDVSNLSAVTWTAKGLATNDTAYINTSTAASKIIDSCESSNELTIETWIIPANTNQAPLSRIITLSNNYTTQNFAIMQSGDRYIVRMRSTEPLPSAIGEEGVSTAAGTVHTKLTHLVFSRKSTGISRLYINGNVAWEDTGGGDFSNWWATNRLQIANDFGKGAWLGTYYRAAIYNRALDSAEVASNYSLGVDIDRAPSIIIEPQDLGLLVGQNAQFSVKIVGDSSSYQWRRNGVNLGGEILPTLSIPSVGLSNNLDTYSCIVTNSFGSDTSRDAKLFVTAANSRVTTGQLALYTFQEASGDTIKDVSGSGTPLNMRINSPSDIQWKPYGLFVNASSDIYSVSDATKINIPITNYGEFTAEVWVDPANLTQSPATILTLENLGGPERINFTMNQQGNSLRCWLRTTDTPESGSFIESPVNSISDSLIHIIYVHNKKELSKIYINGIEVRNGYALGDLSNWRPDYYLKIANKFVTNQPWNGFYNLVSFYDRALSPTEISHNYSQGPVNINLNAPSNLTVQANQTRKLDLKWKDNSTNEDGFIIERKEAGFGFVVIDSVAANDTMFTDANLKDTTLYTYRIKAYNLFKQSAFSNEASAITLQFVINAPSNLTSSLIPVDVVRKVKLDWTDNSTNELGFAIQRKNGDSASVAPFVSIDSVNAGVVTFTDFTVTDTTTYTYRIFAFNADTVSGFSNTATISTILSTIQAPSNLAASLVPVEKELAVRKVKLDWTDNSTNELGFAIQRKNGDSASVAPFVSIDSVNAGVVTFTDFTVTDTTTYTYRIFAFNADTVSGFSNTATISTILSTIQAPTNLAASLVPVEEKLAVRKVKLDWTDNSTNELGFAIQRKNGDSASVAPFVSIDSVNAGVVTFTDLTVADTTTYTYRIFAFNADTVSGFSNIASISTILSTIQAPTNLVASLIPVDVVRKVKLDWLDNSTNELGFAIQRKTGDSTSVAPFVSIDSVNAGVVTFTDLTVADTTTYTYRIFAFNADTVSGFSNIASIATILSTIQAPSNLIASLSLPDTHKVKLTWIDNSSNELGFILQRKLGDTLSVSPYLNLDTLFANATMYVDTTVQDSTTYTYRVYAFNADTVSPFSNRAQITTPVPVEFTSFTASVVSGYVSLNWTTATEINNAGFSIQRSQENNKFIDIGFIKGNGTTTTSSEYRFVDKTVQFGKYVYRLKQVDYDGSSSYTNSILVDLGLPKDFSLDQNYPNPFNPSTTIRFALPTGANVSLILYNALGQEVHNILNTDLEAGIHEVKFNASSLSSGVYFYMLKAEGINGSSFTSTKRMILMK